MTHRVDPDYDPSDSDIERAAVLLARTLVRTPLVYNEKGNGNGFQKWLLGIMALLIAMGVGGSIVMYGEMTRMQARIDSMQDQLVDIRKLIEPRFRGG